MSKKRLASVADIYHVVARGSGRQTIFECDRDYAFFMKLLSQEINAVEASLLAWCLMANHVHLLVRAEKDDLSMSMQRALATYAAYFNRENQHVGHVFQGRYKSEPVNDDRYLVTVIRYIHFNPVKAGIAPVGEYPWSSYNEYIAKPRYCDTSFPLAIIGGIDAFKRLHEIELTESCLDIEDEESTPSAMPDDKARAIATTTLGDVSLSDLKTLPRETRDAKLVQLKACGLTVRQIERLTGIGRGIVQRAR